jgi:hypothetical protein
VRSDGARVYLVEFEFGAGMMRYLWGSSDGWIANVVLGSPETERDAIDVAGATRAIDELLTDPTASGS